MATRPSGGSNAPTGTQRPNGAPQNKICQFKLVLLGESAVGKSSLVLRFVKGQFHEYQESTIGGNSATHFYQFPINLLQSLFHSVQKCIFLSCRTMLVKCFQISVVPAPLDFGQTRTHHVTKEITPPPTLPKIPQIASDHIIFRVM